MEENREAEAALAPQIPTKTEGSSALSQALTTTEYVGNEQKNNDGFVYQIMYQHHPNHSYSHSRIGVPHPMNRVDMVRVPVTCGSASAKMHLNLFLCPGIHQACIEINGEFISPKQFTILGDKEKQKDWKASIRIGKSSLRAHMESGTIEFFDHPRQCSGKCQSRNYVNTPTMRAEVMQIRRQQRNVDTNSLRRELEDKTSSSGENKETTVETVNEDGVSTEKKIRLNNSQEGERRGRGRPRGSGNKKPKKEIAREYFYGVPESNPIQASMNNIIKDERLDNGCSAYFDIMQCLQYEPQHFWSQMQNAGVLSQFCDDIIISAINMKHSVLAPEPVSEKMAAMLSKAVFALNIQKTVVNRVQVIERCYSEDRKRVENTEKMKENSSNKNENNVLTLDDAINEDPSKVNQNTDVVLPMSDGKVDKTETDPAIGEEIAKNNETALEAPYASISDDGSTRTAIEF